MSKLTINKKHPKFIKFLKNEKKTLEWIGHNKYVTANFANLAQSALKAASTFPKEKHLSTHKYEFNCQLDLFIENQSRRTYVEIVVEEDFKLASYSLSIFNSTTEPLEIIRKIHFDYAMPSPNMKEPKPVYH